MPEPPELAVWFPIYALAMTRLVGLVALDAITDAPRVAITLATDQRSILSWIGYLVNCAWCTGVWVAVPFTAAVAIGHGSPWLGWPVMALALAQVAGMLSNVGRG
jgi:hypothetical protein